MGQTLGEAANALGEAAHEAQALIDRLNDNMMPAVRKRSTKALHDAARSMKRFAATLTKAKRQPKKK